MWEWATRPIKAFFVFATPPRPHHHLYEGPRHRLGYRTPEEFAEIQQHGAEMPDQFRQNSQSQWPSFWSRSKDVRKSLIPWTKDRGPFIIRPRFSRVVSGCSHATYRTGRGLIQSFGEKFWLAHNSPTLSMRFPSHVVDRQLRYLTQACVVAC